MKTFKEFANERGFFKIDEASNGSNKSKDNDGALTMDAKDFPIEECAPEVVKVHQCFSNPNLKNYNLELQKPTPDEKYFHTGDTEHHKGVARSLISHSPELRKELKFEKRKVYVVGGAVRNWLYQKMHLGHKMDPLKPCAWSDKQSDWDLATDAHPDEVWVILHQGMKEGILPPGTDISWGSKTHGVVKVMVPSIRDPKKKIKVEIKPFSAETNKPGDPEETGPRFLAKMGDDYKGRDVTYNALYFDMDEKKIYDPTKMGIGDLAQRQTRFVDPEKVKEDPVRGLRFAKNHSDILGQDKKKSKSGSAPTHAGRKGSRPVRGKS